jgi:hypothetical protein
MGRGGFEQAFIAFEKIQANLRDQFVRIQDQVMAIVGYNFEFTQPFTIIHGFLLLLWEKTKRDYSLHSP